MSQWTRPIKLSHPVPRGYSQMFLFVGAETGYRFLIYANEDGVRRKITGPPEFIPGSKEDLDGADWVYEIGERIKSECFRILRERKKEHDAR